jgi:hypothetical protein
MGGGLSRNRPLPAAATTLRTARRVKVTSADRETNRQIDLQIQEDKKEMERR